jgi:hypothetical protein
MAEEQTTTVEIKLVVSGYTESQKRAIMKYAKNNKDKIREIHKRHHDKLYKTDEYREYNREYMRGYYAKNKEKIQRQRALKKKQKKSMVNQTTD